MVTRNNRDSVGTRQSEVRNPDLSLAIQEEVRGLDVAMNDAVLVGVVQRPATWTPISATTFAYRGVRKERQSAVCRQAPEIEPVSAVEPLTPPTVVPPEAVGGELHCLCCRERPLCRSDGSGTPRRTFPTEESADGSAASRRAFSPEESAGLSTHRNCRITTSSDWPSTSCIA